MPTPSTFVDTISHPCSGVRPMSRSDPAATSGTAWTSYTWPGLVVSDDHEPSEYPSDMNVMVPVHASDRG